MNLEFKSGIFYGVPEAEYHKTKLGECSSSALKLIDAKTPAHYRQFVEDRSKPKTAELIAKESKAFRLGRIVHAAILEPDRFEREFLVQPDFGDLRSSKNRDARNAWLESQGIGAQVVDAEDRERALAMREAILRHKTARLVIENGSAETTMRWRDPATGLECKSRTDWFCPQFGFMLDLKTTEDASPMGFGRSVAKYGYHLQASHYTEGAKNVTDPIKHFLFLAIEKSPPHALCVYHLDSSAEERGEQLRLRAMSKMAACVESGQWPGYPTDFSPLTIPGYAFSD